MNLRFVTKSNCVCMCALYHSRQQEELGQLQAELHDAESADDGIYGALRAQDRGAAVDTTATVNDDDLMDIKITVSLT